MNNSVSKHISNQACTYTYNTFSFYFVFNATVGWAFVLTLVTLLFSSCRTKQPVATTKVKCNAEFRTARHLSQRLKENEFKFKTLDGKLNVESTIDSSSNTFSATVRIKKDSAIWVSISKLGVEAVRVFATQDSLFFLNRMNKQYFRGNYIFLSKQFNTQLDYEILQSLLVGNSVTFYDDDERLKASISDCRYMLGTIRKRKLKKITVKGKELKEPAQTIYLNPDTFKILRILFYDFDLDRHFNAEFSDFVSVDSVQLFPTKLNYQIKSQKNINVNMVYTKQKFNEEVNFSFKIPDTYEQIEIKEK